VSPAVNVIGNHVCLVPDFLSCEEGNRLFQVINRKAKWQQQEIRIYGKNHAVPRLTAWHGDHDAIYRYSGIENIPHPWFCELVELRRRIQGYTRSRFNSVLLNLYRNGNDSMGRHSDDEPELGDKQVIASISLGATRRLIFHPQSSENRGSIRVNLDHCSLVVMSGNTQRDWKHSIPKTGKPVGPRINLTYRWVNPEFHNTYP